MTRDHQRDLEANGDMIVSWYCPKCGHDLRVQDEVHEDRDIRAHLERHRAREARRPVVAP
jgi:tRNA(Ile2) C34 agmatinyltransferase TiaS